MTKIPFRFDRSQGPMPIFQITDDDGEIHHFEAPNEESAYKVLALLQGGAQGEGDDDASTSRRVSSSFQPMVSQPQATDDHGGDDESSLPGMGRAFCTGLANGTIKLAGIPGDVVGQAGGCSAINRSNRPFWEQTIFGS